ncbi:hybrid sensor histidine kinase/response regulator [Rhodoferax sp. GW822-FHT02A01]|uniref:ATP-binding response regulator n=1 Tax=Rhodoferax sp. GW822-FHT02A01 TaxID=3141537 RepID=UPI00315DF6F5
MQEVSEVNILVVDDERAQMQALCDTLKDQGFHTIGFNSGRLALDALRTGHFSLLLTDLMMPELDGIALLQAAQQIDPQLVCIIMTGNGTITTAVEAMRVGALDYILKPFKLSAILPVLTRALAVRKLRIENAALTHSLHEHTLALESANSELERARRAKDHFMATMSHELRTPLNAILGFAEILQMKLTGPLNPEQEEHVEIICSSGKHLLSLINDLLDLARIESGKIELNPEPVMCQALLKEVAAAMQVLAVGKGLVLDVHVPTSEVRLNTDRRALFQIVMNLANNAIKYTPMGSVTLDLSQTADGSNAAVCISVSDTGVGISAQDQARLFSAFTQVGEHGKGTESTGLGLYLSGELAKLLGGRITLKSEVGCGSTFTLTLPNMAHGHGV